MVAFLAVLLVLSVVCVALAAWFPDHFDEDQP